MIGIDSIGKQEVDPCTREVGMHCNLDGQVSSDAPVNLSCSEVWGGNLSFHGPVELPGIRGVLYTKPCDGSRGGDVHYLSVCGSGLLSRVCLADVMGHGESVAAVSQEMYDLLRRSVNRIDERKVLRKLNLRLSGLKADTFTTAAAMTYFAPTRKLSISYAGHEPAWYYEASRRRWIRLHPDDRKGLINTILAVAPTTRFTRCARRTSEGDRVLIITDGLIEAPNSRGEMFGRDRLTEVLESTKDEGSNEVVTAVMEALNEHMSGGPMNHDDVSILLLDFVHNLAKPALWTALQNRLFR